jgi:hypothetical protein
MFLCERLILKLTEANLAFLENRHDGEEATRSRDEGGGKADTVMVAAPPAAAVTGEVRKSCRPGE